MTEKEMLVTLHLWMKYCAEGHGECSQDCQETPGQISDCAEAYEHIKKAIHKYCQLKNKDR